MTRPRIQFSLRSMFFFCAIGAVMLAVNLRPTMTTGEIFLSRELPIGESHMSDWIMIERGFPLRYQQSRWLFAHHSLDAGLTNGPTTIKDMRAVTHSHWLIADIVFGLFAAAICGWALPRYTLLLPLSHNRNLSTNHPMQPSGEVGRFEVEGQPSPPADR